MIGANWEGKSFQFSFDSSVFLHVFSPYGLETKGISIWFEPIAPYIKHGGELMPIPEKIVLTAAEKLIGALVESSPRLAQVASTARDLLSEEARSLQMEGRIKAPVSLATLLRQSSGEITELDNLTVVPTRIIDAQKKLSIDVLSGDGLFGRVAREKANNDLFKSDRVNGARISRLHYLDSRDASGQTHVTLSKGSRIIGIAGLQTNYREPSELWVQHVSVEKQHQGMGYAGKLVESVYDYALRRGQKVSPSSFTVEGQRLKHVFDRLDLLHPEAASGIAHQDF